MKEGDWSSDSDEGAREDALDAAGLGDVRDVYQVQPGSLKHLHVFLGGCHKSTVYITVSRIAIRSAE